MRSLAGISSGPNEFGELRFPTPALQSGGLGRVQVLRTGPGLVRLLARLSRNILAGAIFLVIAMPLEAAFSYTVDTPVVAGYAAPGYVIDSDANVGLDGYERHVIPVSVQVTASKTGFSVETTALTAHFRLIDQTTNETFPMAGASGSPPRVASGTVAGQFIFPSSQTVTLTADLEPAERLDPFTRYRIEVLVTASENGNRPITVGTTTSVPDYGFIHFTGPYATDPAMNVVAVLNSVSAPRRWLVQTDSANNTFQASVSFTLHRYDEPHVSPSSHPINVRIKLELLPQDEPGTPIVLESDLISLEPQPVLPTWVLAAGPSQVPATLMLTRTLNFRPAPGVQLDSVNRLYSVRATISHVEAPNPVNPFNPVTLTGNSRQTSNQRFLHYNGKLFFGAISTTMRSISNNPQVGAGVVGGHVRTTLEFAADGGELDGKTDYTFGPGSIQADLNAAGEAFCVSPSSIDVNSPVVPDMETLHNVRFIRQGLVLHAGGLRANNVVVILPAGFGFAGSRTERGLTGRLNFGSVALTQALMPTTNLTITPPPGQELWVTRETLPVSVRASQIVWRVNAGEFECPPFAAGGVHHVRTPEMAALAASPVPAAMKIKRSNEAYWRYVSAVGSEFKVTAGSDGGAKLRSTFDFNAGGAQVRTHFPYDAMFRPTTGSLSISDDKVETAPSQLTLMVSALTLPISADCIEPFCGTTADTVAGFNVTDNQLQFTEDGGLIRPAVLTALLELRWGWIPAPISRYAHRTDAFNEGVFHMTGHFLRGNLPGPQLSKRPAALLFAGATTTGAVTERPGMASYNTGNADYAGLNFRAGTPRDSTDSGMQGESTLAAKQYGPYALKKRSKYYVRKSGISGIHDKVFGSPETVLMHDYEFTLTNFGLAFLSNENTDSRTEGSLFLPSPSNYTLEFEKLLFRCNGALKTATVKGGVQSVTAAYWGAPLDVSAMDFVRDPAQECNPAEGFLAIGVAAYMAHVEDTLYGILGVFPHGNMIPEAKGIPDLDSRLIAPSQAKIRGPKKAAPGASGFETYRFTPVDGAYFNNTGSAPNFVHNAGANIPPFLNMPGLMKVSFFEALEAHLQTASHRPPEDPNNPGPWGAAAIFLANGDWSGSSFFKPGYHDNLNRGFPGTATVANLNDYREAETYFVRAKQNWLGGAIKLNYPVMWDTTTRSFRSKTPIHEEFVVFEIEHRIAYLSAERADVRFGAHVGLPQLNLANFVVNTLDDATGMAQTVVNAIGDGVVSQIDQGLGRFNELLADQIDAHLDRFIGQHIDGLVNAVYANVAPKWSGNDWIGGTAPEVDTFFIGAASDFRNQILQRLGATSVAGGLNQVQQIQDHLQTVIDGIDIFIHPSTGVLRVSGDTVDVAVVQTLVRALIQELAGSINSNLASVVGGAVASVLDELMAPYLDSVKPTLREVHDALATLKSALESARDALDVGGEFRAHIQALHTTALGAEFNSVSTKIRDQLNAELKKFGLGAGKKHFGATDPDEIKIKIRNTIKDRLRATAFVADLQTVIKHRVFDLNVSMRTAMDSAFGQVNEIVRNSLTSALNDLGGAFAGAAGNLGSSMFGASLDGYAIFNGDALRKVRIDGKFQWAIPTETTFTAYLEINQFQSDGETPSCFPEGETAVEVILGATDVPCDFLSPDMRVSIETKLSFLIQSQKIVPVGLAGSFAMTKGEITFQAFAITDLAAGVAFGKFENYISAALGLRFNSYKAKGGVFFGRTCSIAPIALWDPFAAQAIGNPNPTFTGGYVYGECHVPVSEALLGIPATCFFRVTAGMGCGIFFFIEGPTYGARGMLAVSGDALCILSLSGRVDLIGVAQGSKFKLNGKGSIAVEIGACPFCIKASKSVKISTEMGGGKAKGNKPSVN